MSASYPELRLATRSSRLAVIQAEEAAGSISRLLPFLRFELLHYSTPGDRDKTADLRESAEDFFTRDLHAAVMEGAADCAVHSAKDLEENPPPGVDWFWLPGPADPRDVIVLRRGESRDSQRAGGVVGISSARREEYCRRQLPGMRTRSIRGTIEERLAQLDAGAYDALIMAGAALQRLGLRERITAWIAAEVLVPPPGQGYLALTFRAGDERFLRLRSLFVKPVVFAGAGCGSAETCTLGALSALTSCEICVHDSLLDLTLLERLPPEARRVDVGKRCGAHAAAQDKIDALLATAARQGRRVLRLKGGDPGMFGRLAEEIGTLDALHLPYRVIPGVSSLQAATTGTGMLLTRRAVTRGFVAMSAREGGGGIASVRAEARAELPLALFMGGGVLADIVAQLRADGLPATTRAAVVCAAGSADEAIVRGDLSDIVAKLADVLPSPTPHAPSSPPPALVLIGAPAATAYHPEWGALAGRRVLLPGSDALAEKSVAAVRERGGTPVTLPLVRLVPEASSLPVLRNLSRFDWLAVTSPAAARILLRLMREAGADLRTLPKIAVAGPGTAGEFRAHGIAPELTPDREFGAAGILAAVRRAIPAGAAILRLRSAAAGAGLAQALIAAGYRATDCILYRNETIRPSRLPAFDAVFFASASAVGAFLSCQSANALAGKAVVAMGQPTLDALERQGVRGALTPPTATVDAAIETLAAHMVGQELIRLPLRHPIAAGR
jgi:uroporphyrinogen III methyltransferase/synthase